MNIWQFIIVAMAVLKFGSGLRSAYTKEGGTDRASSIVASIIIFVVSMAVFYKANVLIINL